MFIFTGLRITFKNYYHKKLNYALFIASRIIKGEKNAGNISKPIVKISVLGIALGLIVMILSISIINGFKTKIRDKVIGFGGHIQIQHFDANTSFEPVPINKNQKFISQLKKNQNIRHIQSYAIKSGIIKTDNDIQGVILKGISNDFDWSFFNDKLLEGKKLTFSDTASSNEIIISKNQASKLKLKLGDDLLMYFIQQPPRVRKFKIAGIYQTGLEEFDKLYLLGDIKHIQKLNDWNEDQIAGFEIYINHFDKSDEITDFVNDQITYDLNAKSIKELNPQIFDWLNLQDINVAIILTLMILVGVINMIATLLILILEKTPTIGLLKAMGMKNSQIQKIFLINGAYIIGKGLFWGNLIGLSLCYIQLHFGIIKLNEANYYLKEVPVLLDFWHILFLNLGIFLICIFMLIIPSYFISKITPVKAIRFS